jgi:hypothetical protein
MKWSPASPKNLGIRPFLHYPQEHGLPAFFMLKFSPLFLASNHFLTPENFPEFQSSGRFGKSEYQNTFQLRHARIE